MSNLAEQLKQYTENDLKMADIVPIRKLNEIIEKTPSYEMLILEGAKNGSVSSFLSSLVTQEKSLYKTQEHENLAKEIISNLTESEKEALSSYIS